MAKMIYCKGCGKEISKKAKACPNCGEPVPKTSLLKWLFLIILIFTLFDSIQTLSTVRDLAGVVNQSTTSRLKSYKKDAVTGKQKLIPRSYPEKCKYYLVDSKIKNGIKRVVSKQVCAYNGVSGHPTRFISDTKKEDIFCNSILA